MLNLSVVTTLGYRFLLDPLPVDAYWLYFVVFLLLMVGVGYKAITTPDPRKVPGRVAWFFFKSFGLMFVLGLLAWLLTART